jgi:two-component system, cell cycle response regulator
MSTEYNDIALVGFTQSEFATFETFFRLVSSRRPRPFRASAQIVGAKLVMLSTTLPADIERTLAALAPGQSLVTVGTRRVAGAWRHLDRPINLNAVLATVDSAVNGASAADASKPVSTAQSAPMTSNLAPAARTLPPVAPVRPLPSVAPIANPAVAPVVPSVKIAPAPVQVSAPSLRIEPQTAQPQAVTVAPMPVAKSSNVTPFPSPASNPPVAVRASVSSLPPSVAREPAAAPATGAARVNILVVDDSDVALKFIHARLSAFGFHVDKCSSGEEALVRVADDSYQFVFLDVMMEGLDGYQTCKAIKGRKYSGGKAPVVVMLTSRSGTIDKVRGTFAGCDAYLTKPLDETKMLKVLLKHDAEIGNSISTLASPPTASPAPRASAPESPDPLSAAYSNLSDRAH